MIEIKKDRCIGCGICVSECMANCLKFDDDCFHIKVDEDKCLQCGLCELKCPVNAISVTRERNMDEAIESGFLFASDIFDLQKKIESGELIDEDNCYHTQIAEALENDYALAFECFAECSLDFFLWFSKDFWFEIAEIIVSHQKRELLILLKNNIVKQAGTMDVGNLDLIYHFAYTRCH